jgi:crotonobetainyl-CoA:carnitine CoA-transferase CaiB-like acyl-CoA transferase
MRGMNGPLSGVLVADFTEYVAGPYATMMLADMGAEVVKVEPWEGDHWRRQQPIAPHTSRYFVGVNRGKKSICARLDHPEGRKAILDLVARADVVIANYRPGIAEALGLDYESLRKLQPRLIYCAISAFGSEGPLKDRPGFDLIVQAATGLMDYERRAERGVPVGVTSFAPGDLSTGMFSAFAVVNALYQRERTGEGQRIDASLFASALAIQYRPLLLLEALDREQHELALSSLAAARENGASYKDTLTFRAALGLARPTTLYYRVYQTRDSLIAVACLNNRQRRGLCAVLGVDDAGVQGDIFQPPVEVDADEHEARVQEYEARFRERPAADWLAALDEAGVPCVPVVMNEEVFDHPHVVAAGLMLELEHPQLGTIRQPGSPLRMSGADTGEATPAPLLGEHSVEMLRRLGYDDERIEALVAGGAIRTPDTSSYTDS